MACLLESEPLPGIIQLTLNLPTQRNPLVPELVAAMRARLTHHRERADTRVVLLRAAGAAFSCGAELQSTLQLGRLPLEDNAAEARGIFALLSELRDFPKPTVAVVQGPALGLGVGLVAVCDVAIGSEEARFCLSEVRMGLAPTLTAGWLIEAMGARHFRRYALSGEMMSAERAREISLLHEVVPLPGLGGEALRLAVELAQGGASAIALCKSLAGDDHYAATDCSDGDRLAVLYAQLRRGQEAQEGVSAMAARRPPSWSQGQ